MTKPKVVIIGGGFAGVHAAKNLLSSSVEIVLIDRHNYHTFQPLLHHVATGFIEPEQAAYPLRSYFRNRANFKFHLAEVQKIDWDNRLVVTNKEIIKYDYLVMATGSAINYVGVSGAQEYTWNLKTLPAAISLRNHIWRCLEMAGDRNNNQAILTFAVVGGGSTGVEMVGSLAELVRGSMRQDYPDLIPKIRIVLIHSQSTLVNSTPKLHRYTAKKLNQLGVELYLETRVGKVTKEGVALENGEFIPSHTVIWTAGVRSNSLNTNAVIPIASGQRIPVLPTLQLSQFPNVFVAGDLAGSKHNNHFVPMVAPAAIQQGKAVAHNITRQILGRKLIHFQYRHLGSMTVISRHSAIAQIGRLSLTGWFAWLLWLAIHLINLSGIRHRLFVLINWLWSYFTNEQPHRLICPTRLKTTPQSSQKISLTATLSNKS